MIGNVFGFVIIVWLLSTLSFGVFAYFFKNPNKRKTFLIKFSTGLGLFYIYINFNVVKYLVVEF